MFSWLTEKISSLPEVDAVIQRIKREEKVMVQGISGSRKSFCSPLCGRKSPGACWYLPIPRRKRRKSSPICGVFSALPGEVVLFPAYDLMAHEEAYEKETAGARLSVLGRLARENGCWWWPAGLLCNGRSSPPRCCGSSPSGWPPGMKWKGILSFKSWWRWASSVRRRSTVPGSLACAGVLSIFTRPTGRNP